MNERCANCFCQDLCYFVLSKSGPITSCEDFRKRVEKVVHREFRKLYIISDKE